MTVNFLDETKRLSENLKDIILRAAKEAVWAEGVLEGCSVSVDILIVDLESMRKINRDTRRIDAPTDVLSFPADELVKGVLSNCTGTLFLGDIVIACEKIFSQACEYGHSAEREAGFLTAHAMLHLMGYDHETDEGEAEMIGKQEEILGRMGLRR